jgi:hypothetical protein
MHFSGKPSWAGTMGRRLASDVLDTQGWFVSTVSESYHEAAAHAHQVSIYRAMTPQQRLQQGLRMNRTMRELMAVGFRDRQPDWTEAQIFKAVADRILYARTG